MFKSYYPEFNIKHIKKFLNFMIQVGSMLRVSDNSGAKYASCIKSLGSHKKRYARIGDKIVVSIVSLRAKRRSQTKIQKGKVNYGIFIKNKINKFNKSNIKKTFLNKALILIT